MVDEEIEKSLDLTALKVAKKMNSDIDLSEIAKEAISLMIEKSIEQSIDNTKNESSEDIDIFMASLIDNLLTKEIETRGPIVLLATRKLAAYPVDNDLNITLVIPEMPRISNLTRVESRSGYLLTPSRTDLELMKNHIQEIFSEVEIENPGFIVLPELGYIDYDELDEIVRKFAQDNNIFVICGSYHEIASEKNICKIFTPRGEILEQEKIHPAIELGEGIQRKHFGAIWVYDIKSVKFSVLICADALSGKIHSELIRKYLRCKCPELIFSPSANPVPQSSHQDLQYLMRHLTAATIFCNDGEYGGSTAFYPDSILKDEDFMLITPMVPSKQTQYAKLGIDILTLLQYKKSNVKCLIATGY